MRNYLKSHELCGCFEFISGLIHFHKYDSKLLTKIQESLKLKIFNDDYSNTYNTTQVDFITLFYHELTHFLDFTTTCWGIEYQIRKTNYALLREENTLSVFKVSYSELLMHKSLLRIDHTPVNLQSCKIDHVLEYNETFGGLIHIRFFENDIFQLSSSINMLSLIEAHAYVTEILVKIRCIECDPDISNREYFMDNLNTEVNRFLNNVNMIEYNMFIILTKKHFKSLSIKELFYFLKCLFLKVLNFNMELSQISNFILHSMTNKVIGKVITADINRGMSRHIVTFKLILFMYDFLDNHEKLILLKKNPSDFIEQFLKKLKIISIENYDEFEGLLELYKEKSETFDNKIIYELAKFNRKDIYPHCILKNIEDYKLLDFFLDDGGVVTLPNRYDLNIEEYFFSDDISDIDKKTSTSIKKFHMNLENAKEFYSHYGVN